MFTRRRFLAAAGMAMVPRQPRSSLIDSHVHVWKTDPQYPFAQGAKVPVGDASAEALLRLMQANGVSRTVLIQVIHYKWDNRYLVDTLRRYPGTFAGVCRVNPESPSAPDDLSRWTEAGCRGVRLSPAGDAQGDWIKGPLMLPLWRRCAALKVPMTLLLPAIRLSDVRPLIEKNPELTVVIDHMADSPLDDKKLREELYGMARYPRVFVKISHLWSLSAQSYPYRDTAAMVAGLRDAFGAERLMWGTDWPIKPELATYAQRVALYTDPGNTPYFNPRERQEILSKTVKRVWPI